MGARRGGWRPCSSSRRAIGDVVGVTHLHDKPLPPIAGTPFDDVPHMLVSDYLVHWVDISALLAERRSTVNAVQAGTAGCPASRPRPATPGPRPWIRLRRRRDRARCGSSATRGPHPVLPVLDPRHRGNDPRQHPRRDLLELDERR